MKPTKTTTTETIARVRELDAKATEGPWAHVDEYADEPKHCVIKTGEQNYCIVAECVINDEYGNSCAEQRDADLIAEYRTLCPQLADRCEALEKALSVAKEALNGVLNSAFDPVIAKYSSMTPLPPVRLALSEINKLTNQ